MSKQSQLVKNTLIIAVGKLSTQFLTFLLLPVYTAFLSPEEYGALDLITVYMGVLAPVFTMQMEMAVFRHLIDARGSKESIPRVVSSSFTFVVLGTLVGVITLGLIGMAFSLPLTPYVIGVFVTTVLVSYFLQVARGLGRNDIFAVASILTGLLNIILSVLALVILHWSLPGILGALIVANTVGTIFLIWKTNSYRTIRFNAVAKSEIRSLIAYAWPLVPNHISLWGINGISRSIVAGVLGLAAMGIYAAAGKFTIIYTSFYGVFAMSWTESVSLHIWKKDSFLSNATNSTVKFFGSLSFLIISASIVVFPLLVAPDFTDAKNYIPLLILGGFFASLVTHYGAIYLAAKETKRIAVVTLQALIVSTLLTFVGVWIIGLYAPAIAILVTYAYIAIRRHYDVQRLVAIKYSSSTILPVVILGLFVLVFYYIDNTLLNILSLLVTIIAAAMINKSDIYKIKNTILKKGSV